MTLSNIIISSNADLLASIEKHGHWKWSWLTPEFKRKYERLKKATPFKIYAESKIIQEDKPVTRIEREGDYPCYDDCKRTGRYLVALPHSILDEFDLNEGDELEITTRRNIISLKKIKEKKND